MIDDNSYYKLIDSKVIDYAEIIVCLFDHCNMKCVFCPQEHDSTLGASRSEIMSKVPDIVKFINENNRSTYFKIHLMGGELFQDVWIEKGFLNIYQEFIDEIKKQVPPGKIVVPNFVTNLVFDSTDQVKDLLNRNNLKISISYDPRGRFTGNQFEVFKRNIEIFKPYITMCSLVLTKQNMKAVIDGDSYFDYLYSNFVMDWDSLIPAIDGVSEKLMPKESEMLEFYKHLVDYYPKCLNITYFTEPNQENKMSCTRGNNFTVLRDGSIPNGCSGSVLIKNNESKETWSPVIVQKFFDQYNCFECEYFKKCSFTCFIKNDYKKIERDLGECVFKETYRYVESKNSKNSLH
jgi:hypothetical protein